MTLPGRRTTWLILAGALLLALASLVLWTSRPSESEAPPSPSASSHEPGTVAPAGVEATAARPTGVPILLIGLDGADWQLIRPLVEAGELPNLRGLMERGAWGVLRSEEPIISPMLWTTIATGREPLDHGVFDFLEADPVSGDAMPVTVRARRVPALWDIYSAAGLDFALIGWWASWPAYPAGGRVVSDRVAFSAFPIAAAEADADALFYPAALGTQLHSLQVEPHDVTFEQFARLAVVQPELFRKAEARLDAIASAFTDPVNHLRNILASTFTYHRMALALLEEHQPDLFAVYYEGIDEVSHLFSHCSTPALAICKPGMAGAFDDTVNAFYRIQDELIGELLSRVRPETVVAIVSDHGFRSGGDRPAKLSPHIRGGRAVQWHRLSGILLLSGPPILPGQLPTTTLRDIAPTLLYLSGLPLAAELDGRPILDAVHQEFRDANPAIGVAAYSPWDPTRLVPTVSLGDERDRQAMEKLLALGYLAGEDATGVGPLAARWLTTEGLLRERKGELAEARRLLRRALDLDPGRIGVRVNLAGVNAKMGRLDDALRLYAEVLANAVKAEPRAFPSAAKCYLEAGRVEEGLELFVPIARDHPDLVLLQAGLGALQHGAGRTEEAERTLRRALALEPASYDAMIVLLSLLESMGRAAEAVPLLRRAVEANPDSAAHHQWLGRIAESGGRLDEAAGHYQRATRAAPHLFEPEWNLGRIYARTDRRQEAERIFRTTTERFPDEPRGPFSLGVLLEISGDLDGAQGALLAAERRGMREAELYRRLGRVAAAQGRKEEARDQYRTALTINPDHPAARRELEALVEGADGQSR